MENTLKLLLPLTVTLLLCINPAAGLKCHKCAEANCPTDGNTDSCTDKEKCMTFTFNETSGGQSTVKYKRMCASADKCSKAGLLSLTSDRGLVLANVTCCKSDYCNKDAPRIPSVPSGGTMKCPTCDTNDPPCTSTIKCSKSDTHCYSYTESFPSSGTKHDYGCASAKACSSSLMMTELYHFSTKADGYGVMYCRPPPAPPIQCEVCVDPCQPCSDPSPLTAAPGMRCMSATITEPGKDPKHLKGMAAAPLCSSDGHKSLTLGQALIQVNCCSFNDCNGAGQHSGTTDADVTCPSDSCPTPLQRQLELLTNRIVFLPTPAAPTATGQPQPPQQP